MTHAWPLMMVFGQHRGPLHVGQARFVRLDRVKNSGKDFRRRAQSSRHPRNQLVIDLSRLSECRLLDVESVPDALSDDNNISYVVEMDHWRIASFDKAFLHSQSPTELFLIEGASYPSTIEIRNKTKRHASYVNFILVNFCEFGFNNFRGCNCSAPTVRSKILEVVIAAIPSREQIETRRRVWRVCPVQLQASASHHRRSECAADARAVGMETIRSISSSLLSSAFNFSSGKSKWCAA